MNGRMDRYVAGTVAGAYAAALVFLLSMFVVFDLLFEMNTYMTTVERGEIDMLGMVGLLAEYYVLWMPLLFVSIAPFVTVIASMFALSRLMAANEIAPMIFTGRSMLRILRPMLGSAVISASAMGATWEWVIPAIADEYESVAAALSGRKVSLEDVTLRSKSNPRQELYCKEYRHDLQRMSRVIVYDRGSSRGDGILIMAESALWNPERKDWELQRGLRKTGEGEQRRITDQQFLGMAEVTPHLLVDSNKARRQTSGLSYTELLELMELRPGKSDYVLALHTHCTFPLANLILLLLALPCAVNFERGRRIERIAVSIGVCAVYLLMDLTCQNLVYRDSLHPIVAAWTPTIVFGSLGIVVFGSMRT